MTDLEREAREAAKAAYPPGSGRLGHGIFNGEPAREGFRERYWFEKGYLAAAAPRELELRRLRLLAEEQLTTLRKLKAEMLSDTRDAEIERLRARVVEVTAQRDAFMDSREEVVALRASLVQQAHDYRAQVVFWGDNADQRTAEVASLRARVEELKGMVPKWTKASSDECRQLCIDGWVFMPGTMAMDGKCLMVPPIPLPETKASEPDGQDPNG